MNQKKIRSRALLLLIILMTVAPMVLAWALLRNPEWIDLSTSNHGRLITPAIATEREQWQGVDVFSRSHIDELKGHWVLLNLILSDECKQVCQQALHKTRQIRLMLNKDLTRVRRAVVVLSTNQQQALLELRQSDSRLLQVSVTADLLAKIKIIIDDPIEEGMIMIMDPLGNLMMIYQAGFDPYLIKKDLNKLLRASQIG